MDNRVHQSTFSIEDAHPSILVDTDIARINATTSVGRTLSINTPRCVYATFSQDPTSQPVEVSPDSDVSAEREHDSRASSPDRPGKPPKRRGDTVRFGSQQITHTFVPSPRAPTSPSANAAQWPCSMSLLDLHATCSAEDFQDCDGGVSRRASNMSGRSGTFNECLALELLDAESDSGAISRRASNMRDRSGMFNELVGDLPDDEEETDGAISRRASNMRGRSGTFNELVGDLPDDEEETDGNISRRASNMSRCSGTFDQLIAAQEADAHGWGAAMHQSGLFSSAWADEGVYVGGSGNGNGGALAVSTLRDVSESLLEERVSGANSRRASNMSTAAGAFDDLVDDVEASGAAGHVVSLAGGIVHAPSGGRMSTPMVQVPEPMSPPPEVEWSMRGYLGAGRNISRDLAAASPGEDVVNFAVVALGAPTPQPWAHGAAAPSDYPTPSPDRSSPPGSPDAVGVYPSDYMRMPQDVGPGPVADQQSRLAAIMSGAPSAASSPASEPPIYTYDDCYRHLQRPVPQDSAMDRELERHFSQAAAPAPPVNVWQPEASSSTLDMPGHEDECARHYLGKSPRLSGAHGGEGPFAQEQSAHLSPTSSEYYKQLLAGTQDLHLSGDLGAALSVPHSPSRLEGAPPRLSVRTSPQPLLSVGPSLEEQEILSHVKSILDIAHNLKVHTFPRARAESPPQPRTAPVDTLAHAHSLGHATSMDPALFKAPSALFCRTPRESYAVFASNTLEPSLSNLPRQLSCKTPKQVFAVFAPPEDAGVAVKRQTSPGNLNERRDAQPQRLQSPQPKPFASLQPVATGKGALAQHTAVGIPAGLSRIEIKHFAE